MDKERLLKTLAVLKRRVAPEGQLEVMHGSYMWMAGFEWNHPADEMDILSSEQGLGVSLPMDYHEFLLQNDGAVLFKDLKYGQWGFCLYGTQEIVIKNREWAQNLCGKWQSRFIAFAENLGDANVLVFDTDRPMLDGESYAVLEGNAFDSPAEWFCASRSFGEWLEHLITAQGDKYWEWH